MLIGFNKRSLFTFYLCVLKPYFAMSQANMSLSTGDVAEKYSVAYVTVPDQEVGKIIARGLVGNKLAACVNMIPQVTSIYEWKGEINEDNEAYTAGEMVLIMDHRPFHVPYFHYNYRVQKVLLMIKTRTSKVNELTEYVRSNHPYEVCEVISLPIHNGNPPYLKWIGDTVPGDEK